jgi:hypothetical protein
MTGFAVYIASCDRIAITTDSYRALLCNDTETQPTGGRSHYQITLTEYWLIE